MSAEIDTLYARTANLKAGFTSLIGEAQSLGRRSQRRRRMHSVTLVSLALLLAGSWALRAGAFDKTYRDATRAPFVVNDGDGNPIFRVSEKPRGFLMYNDKKQPAGGGTVIDNGAFFKISSPDGGNTNIVMGVQDKNAFMKLRYGGGESDRIAMEIKEGKPSLNMANHGGAHILSFMQGSSGGGELELFNAGGQLRVKAGISPANYGRVEALPEGNPAGWAIVGRTSR